MSDLSIIAAPFVAPRRREPRPSVFARLRAGWARHRTAHLLAQMDDRTLADIGACRTNVVWDDSRPIWERLDTLR